MSLKLDICSISLPLNRSMSKKNRAAQSMSRSFNYLMVDALFGLTYRILMVNALFLLRLCSNLCLQWPLLSFSFSTCISNDQHYIIHSIYIYIYIYLIYINWFIYVFIYIFIYLFIYVYIYMYIYTYIYTYIYIYMYIYICIYIYACVRVCKLMYILRTSKTTPHRWQHCDPRGQT